MNADISISCPVCGDRKALVLINQPKDYEYRISPKRKFLIHRCGGCNSQFLWPRPNVEELISFYPDDYHAYNEDHGWLAGALVARRNRARQERYLLLTGNRPVRLFDVGCGDCRQFDALRDSGQFSFGGVEINTAMVVKAKSRGYDVHQGTLEELDTTSYEGSFDIVTMYQLVEHVINPRELFAKAKRLLKPGGILRGQLPCINSIEAIFFGKYWAGYHFPRHLQQFSRRGLERCILEAGFDDTETSTALHLQAAISLQNVIVDHFPSGRLQFGKVSYYSALLLAVTPFCIFEFLLGRGGMMNFSARRPI